MATLSSATPGADPVALLADAAAALSGFGALELPGRPMDELASLALLAQRVAHQAHAVVLATTAAFDASGAWELDGAASAASWLRARANLSAGAARSLVRDARSLRDCLPAMAEALAAGEVSAAHVRVVTAVADRYPERRNTISEVDSTLAQAARSVDPPTLRTLVDRWTTAVDPLIAVHNEQDRFATRSLSASRTLDGMVAVDGLLDPDNGAAVLTALEALMHADREPDDDRTPRQRRADALGELARRVLDGGGLPTAGGERPHVHVTIPMSVVLDQQPHGAALDDGTSLTAEAAFRYLCDASLVPILEGEPGQVLDIGRSRRTIPPSLRRAVIRRDRHCVFAGCDATPARCEVHHLVAWAHGGTTSQANLVLLCHRHHRAVHQDGFVLLGTPGGDLRTLRPDGSRVHDAFGERRRLLTDEATAWPPTPPQWGREQGHDPPREPTSF
jgi:hypothetical protein